MQFSFKNCNECFNHEALYINKPFEKNNVKKFNKINSMFEYCVINNNNNNNKTCNAHVSTLLGVQLDSNLLNQPIVTNSGDQFLICIYGFP